MNQLFGVCNLALVPMRAEASDKSEMISQLLFGDHFEILIQQEKWVHIRTGFDDYEGWIDHLQYAEIDMAGYLALHNLDTLLAPSISHLITDLEANKQLNLLAGSNLPSFNPDKKIFKINNVKYKIESGYIKPAKRKFNKDILAISKFYLNAPYLWGGRSIFGIDCSGFSQMVFKQFGIKLKRDACQQAEQGVVITSLMETNPGDLAFFNNKDGKITHVGILLNNHEIIHASGFVKIDRIDNEGIYNEQLKKYTHQLRIIKRYI